MKTNEIYVISIVRDLCSLMSRFKLIIFLILIQLPVKPVNSGLDQFTLLDSIDEWELERRFDSKDQSIRCRASVKGFGTWFGSKIRLDAENRLQIPRDVDKNKIPSERSIQKVKRALRKCSETFLYIP